MATAAHVLAALGAIHGSSLSHAAPQQRTANPLKNSKTRSQALLVAYLRPKAAELLPRLSKTSRSNYLRKRYLVPVATADIPQQQHCVAVPVADRAMW